MGWFDPPEKERWAAQLAQSQTRVSLGLTALDAAGRTLYEEALPRGVLVPRFTPDRPPLNFWMPPQELLRFRLTPGQIVLGKLGQLFFGNLDDRPMVTIAGARAGKTSTVLEPNLCLYPGSMLVLDPKGELSRTAILRRAMGHNVFVLDPFGQSAEPSACFNVIDELDPDSPTIVDDVSSITQALIVDDGDAKARHWNDSARALLTGIILLMLTLAPGERNLITVRQLLTLTYLPLMDAAKRSKPAPTGEVKDRKFFDENSHAVLTLLKAMSRARGSFEGILASIGNRFIGTPQTERGSVFSTAAAQTDFLDSLPLRRISRRSDFKLSALRVGRPTTIVLCLPVGRMQTHYRWLRMVVQMACTVLERLGSYPRDRTPILFMMEEFATLGHMEIMERAAAYFPGFGVKLWTVLQDITQLERYYKASWETFLGNAGLVQCFANGDQATLGYIVQRLEKLMVPFELRTAFSRQSYNQLLMFEGERPAAVSRLAHSDVDNIRAAVLRLDASKAARLRGPGER